MPFACGQAASVDSNQQFYVGNFKQQDEIEGPAMKRDGRTPSKQDHFSLTSSSYTRTSPYSQVGLTSSSCRGCLLIAVTRGSVGLRYFSLTEKSPDIPCHSGPKPPSASLKAPNEARINYQDNYVVKESFLGWQSWNFPGEAPLKLLIFTDAQQQPGSVGVEYRQSRSVGVRGLTSAGSFNVCQLVAFRTAVTTAVATAGSNTDRTM
jgi:hypothetical protein